LWLLLGSVDLSCFSGTEDGGAAMGSNELPQGVFIHTNKMKGSTVSKIFPSSKKSFLPFVLPGDR
jgi:hypothetical protein